MLPVRVPSDDEVSFCINVFFVHNVVRGNKLCAIMNTSGAIPKVFMFCNCCVKYSELFKL